ncbi:MAG TPA: hypothetical protein VFQ92_23260 [Blastocatellia bacterium]|nr:hypothetical protein [Blastocatellia bacterium]
MRKLSLLIAVMVVLAGMSVNAQKKKSGPIGPPVPQYPDIVVEDAGGAGFIQFQPSTGAYKCVICKYDGYTIESIGQVKIDGCNIYLTDLREGYRVLISVNLCTQEGKSAVEMYKLPESATVYIPMPMEEYWSDPNMSDNLKDCVYKTPEALPAPPEPQPVGEVIIQNDADGSFLLLNIDYGAYKFIHCEDGFAMSGMGIVKIDGCNIYFEDLKTDRRVLASLNVCEMQGKAVIEVFALSTKTQTGAPTMQEFITDLNLRDNTTVCGPKK